MQKGFSKEADNISMIDITEMNKELSQLKSSEKRFQTLFEQAPISIEINRDGRTLYVNKAFLKTFGYESSEELAGTPTTDRADESSRNEIIDRMTKLYNGKVSDNSYEITGQRRDGSTFPLYVQGGIILLSDGIANVTFFTDITEPKKIEAELRHQIAANCLLLRIADDFASIINTDLNAKINLALRQINEFDRNDRTYLFLFSEDGMFMNNTHELCGEGIRPEIDNLQDIPVSAFPWLISALKERKTICIPEIDSLPPVAIAEKESMQSQDILSMLVVPIASEGRLIGFLGLDSVVKERNWSEANIEVIESVAKIISQALQRRFYSKALEDSQNLYRAVFENTGAATFITKEDFTILKANKEWEKSFGYTKEELEGKKWLNLFHENERKKMKDYHRERLAESAVAPQKYTSHIIDKSGKVKDCLHTVDVIPGTKMCVSTIADISEFNRLHRALKTTDAVNVDVLHAEDEQSLLEDICDTIIEVGGYRFAWIGYADENQTIMPRAFSGNEDGYLRIIKDCLNCHNKQGIIAFALQSRKAYICKNIETDTNFVKWKAESIKRGFKSMICIPFELGGNEKGIIEIYSKECDVFDEQEVNLLEDMASNLSFGINSLRTRLQRDHSEAELKESMKKTKQLMYQTIESLASIVKVRDPYTADHQKRVTELAAAIAAELNLSEDERTSVLIAASLHDIGKMNIPSDILSKPGKITELEFSLIKSHCQTGFDVIRNINFPWPIDEIILQHHERMDGSGYPQGLKGNVIHLAARIIGVADVIEAMSSHRPYRPALGLDKALEEISREKGKKYDPEVVDACTNLFMNKKFTFS
ncbi:MAG: PAS domain S-box protein [Clostridiaceae bacterium]